MLPSECTPLQTHDLPLSPISFKALSFKGPEHLPLPSLKSQQVCLGKSVFTVTVQQRQTEV